MTDPDRMERLVEATEHAVDVHLAFGESIDRQLRTAHDVVSDLERARRDWHRSAPALPPLTDDDAEAVLEHLEHGVRDLLAGLDDLAATMRTRGHSNELHEQHRRTAGRVHALQNLQIRLGVQLERPGALAWNQSAPVATATYQGGSV